MICTVCGKDVKNPTGLTKHPICPECFSDPIKRRVWLNQIREIHPELLKVCKEIAKRAEPK